MMVDEVSRAHSADSTYKSLFTIGGTAAVIAAVLTLSEVIVLAFYPPPGTINDWFILFQSNRVIALLDFWGLEIPMYIMFAPVFLAFHVVLKRFNPGLMAVATTCALLGIGVFLATNNPLSMLSLSNKYTAATTDAQRLTLLAAGQALLANTSQRAVGGFNTGLFLVNVAGLMVSTVMFQGTVFSKATAYVGTLANMLSLGDYLRQALTPSAVIALLVILPNALCLIIWLSLVGRRLCQLGRFTSQTLDTQSAQTYE